MFCGNCGYKIINVGDGKCPNCSAPLDMTMESSGTKEINSQENSPEEKQEKTKETFLVDKEEQVISKIGFSYLQSFIIYGIMRKTSAILTDKRIYFSGKCYQKSGGHFVEDEREAICELEDIVATGIVHVKWIGLLVMGIILMILGVIGIGIDFNLEEDIPFYIGGVMVLIAIIMLVVYALTRKTWYEVSTAGSTIRLDVFKLGGIKNVKIFDHEVHRQKQNRVDAYLDSLNPNRSK